MYNKWLVLFNSSVNEIPIKNKKEKQKIAKEWLQNGDMKITGNKPSDWSVVLKSSLKQNIYENNYSIQLDRQNTFELVKEAFKTKNKDLLQEAEKRYNENEKNQKIITDNINNYTKQVKDIQEKIFNIRKELYKDNSKNKTILKNKLLEMYKEEKKIKSNIISHIISNQNLVQKGPVPEIPKIEMFSFKSSKKIFTIDNNEKIINSNIINTPNSSVNVIKLP